MYLWIFNIDTAKVRLYGRESNAFSVKVGLHKGYVLSPLLFIIATVTVHHRVLGFVYRVQGRLAYGIALCR